MIDNLAPSLEMVISLETPGEERVALELFFKCGWSLGSISHIVCIKIRPDGCRNVKP